MRRPLLHVEGCGRRSALANRGLDAGRCRRNEGADRHGFDRAFGTRARHRVACLVSWSRRRRSVVTVAVPPPPPPKPAPPPPAAPAPGPASTFRPASASPRLSRSRRIRGLSPPAPQQQAAAEPPPRANGPPAGPEPSRPLRCRRRLPRLRPCLRRLNRKLPRSRWCPSRCRSWSRNRNTGRCPRWPRTAGDRLRSMPGRRNMRQRRQRRAAAHRGADQRHGPFRQPTRPRRSRVCPRRSAWLTAPMAEISRTG